MTTAADQRRLRDADTALLLTPLSTRESLTAYLAQLQEGIAALQSTDDLGSDEANAACDRKMSELWDCYHAAKAKLEATL